MAISVVHGTPSEEGRKALTSVSSVFSNSGPFAGDELEDLLQNEDDFGAACARCNPAFSRSGSVHERTVARRESISNRFGSARSVVRNERRTLVTRRLSTFVSVALRRRRRRASIRCSLIMTAGVSGEEAVGRLRGGVEKMAHLRVAVSQ